MSLLFKQTVLGNTSWCGTEDMMPMSFADPNVKYVKIGKTWWAVSNESPNIDIENLIPQLDYDDNNFLQSLTVCELKRKCYTDRMIAMYVSKLSNEKFVKVYTV